MSFANKNVVITGATSGFGVEVAAAFVKAGAKVVIGGRREEKGAEVAKATGAKFIKVDVADEQSNKDFFAAAKKELGSFDYVWLNAGIEGQPGPNGQAATFSVDNYDKVFGINVRGLLIGQREAIPHVNKGGKVLYTSSVLSVVPMGMAPIYSASKSTVDGLARNFADQFAKSEDERIKTIEVLSINPCIYFTEMVQRFTGSDEGAHGFGNSFNPSGRAGNGDEIAKTILLVASDKNPYKSGDSIICDVDTHWHVRDNEKVFADKAAKEAAAAAAK